MVTNTECAVILKSEYKQVNIAYAYSAAKKAVLNEGYYAEIAWQASLSFNDTTETDFLREYAWVVLSAGMREYIIRRHFPAISRCFHDWQSSKTIVEQKDKCRLLALRIFNNRRKINGIIETAHVINSFGFKSFKETISINPLQVLQSLPFIGPTTRYHLAKNIGLPFAKPDRHLVRLANSIGYSDVQQFCEDIAGHVGDSVPVVDIVLWRFATINNSYLTIFSEAVARE